MLGINYIHPKIAIADARMSEHIKNLHNSQLPLRYTITYETDMPKRLKLGDAGESNPYHLFYYMLSIFYYFDDGKSDITFYYENKRDEYLSETMLSILPARFKRQKQMEEGYEYVRVPGLEWYHDSIGDTVVYSYLRGLYKHIWENTKQERGKRIYISRDSRSNAGRAVTNEKEVRMMLKGLGISSYDPINMTVIDSIRLFKSAEFVTGPHGAGLTWLTFCESNTIFCEVYKNKPLKDHFYHLAKELGIEYWKFTNLISDSATENTDPTTVDDGNYSIDIESYKGALVHLIQKVECKNRDK